MNFKFSSKAKPPPPSKPLKRPAISLDESDSDSEMPAPSHSTLASKKQSNSHISAAIQQDPSIFDYDASVSSTQARRDQISSKKKGEIDPETGRLKARYVANIVVSSEKRKLDLGILYRFNLMIREGEYQETEER
jgi:hypothetical protein